jgi:predicted O-methyltransferase YrrM
VKTTVRSPLRRLLAVLAKAVTIKSLARRLIGEQLWGSLEYYRFPEQVQEWGAFNDQKLRTALFSALMERLSPVAIVETGTNLGTTTEFLAKSGLPIYTVEVDPRFYGFARARLRKWRNVTLLRGDSREALRRWFDGALHLLAGRTVFFYLDAHRGSNLPLAQELEIIFAQCPAAIVMIDDFQVPGDTAYGHCDYGLGKALTPDYIAPAMQAYGLAAFYPATPAVEENGRRRGCVVLVRGAIHGTALASLHLLRPACRAV